LQAFSVLGIQCRLVQRRGRPAAASAVRAAAPVQTPTLFFSSGGMPRKGRERGMKRGCMCTCIMSQDLSRGVLHTCAPSPHMRALAYAPPSMLATPFRLRAVRSQQTRSTAQVDLNCAYLSYAGCSTSHQQLLCYQVRAPA